MRKFGRREGNDNKVKSKLRRGSLGVAIFDHEEVCRNVKTFVASLNNAAVSLANWSLREDNIAIKDTCTKMYEISYFTCTVIESFSEEYLKMGNSLKDSLRQEMDLNILNKKVCESEEKLAKLKKQNVEREKKDYLSKRLSFLEDLGNAELEFEELKASCDAQNTRHEILKAKCIQDSIIQLADGTTTLATNLSIIGKTQKELANVIPVVPTQIRSEKEYQAYNSAKAEDSKCILCFKLPSKRNHLNFLDEKNIQAELDDLPFLISSSAKCICKKKGTTGGYRQTFDDGLRNSVIRLHHEAPPNNLDNRASSGYAYTDEIVQKTADDLRIARPAPFCDKQATKNLQMHKKTSASSFLDNQVDIAENPNRESHQRLDAEMLSLKDRPGIDIPHGKSYISNPGIEQSPVMKSRGLRHLKPPPSPPPRTPNRGGGLNADIPRVEPYAIGGRRPDADGLYARVDLFASTSKGHCRSWAGESSFMECQTHYDNAKGAIENIGISKEKTAEDEQEIVYTMVEPEDVSSYVDVIHAVTS